MNRGTLALLALLAVAFAAGWCTRPSESAPSDAQAAEDSISRLTEALQARQDTLDALRAARAVAAAEDSAATAEAERAGETAERDVAASSVRADSITAEISAQVDARIRSMVADLNAEHELQVDRLTRAWQEEREARFAAQRRVRLLEASVLELEATVRDQAHIIAQHERLGEIRSDRIRSLERQRAGGALLVVLTIGCAFLCGG